MVRYDEGAQDFVLILEDLAGSVQGDQFGGCTDDEIALAVSQAVVLHGAPSGATRRWPPAPAFSRLTEDPFERLERFYDATMEGCLARLGPRLDR